MRETEIRKARSWGIAYLPKCLSFEAFQETKVGSFLQLIVSIG